jgi:hypothetical protein
MSIHMADTTDIVARLRCQNIEVAHLAADTIERLVASEAEARAALNEMLEQQVALLAQLGLTKNGQWGLRIAAERPPLPRSLIR